MVSTFVSVDIWILILNKMSNKWTSTQLKKTSRNLINLRLGKILNKLHYRDDNAKMMKRNQEIEDNGNIEENQQICSLTHATILQKI